MRTSVLKVVMVVSGIIGHFLWPAAVGWVTIHLFWTGHWGWALLLFIPMVLVFRFVAHVVSGGLFLGTVYLLRDR